MANVELDLKQAEINWLTDILKRISMVLESPHYTEEEKLIAITWFAKQGLKVERED
jgi:hypothetical protein